MPKQKSKVPTPVKERIILAASELIRQADGDLAGVSLRSIAQEAGVALGLINYHFGSKEKLVEECVQRIISGVIDAFKPGNCVSGSPAACLGAVAAEVMEYLAAHPAMARVSILGDMASPGARDNTMRTVAGFAGLPGVPQDKMRLFCFTAALQAAFLRKDSGGEGCGFALNNKEERDAFVRSLAEMVFPAENGQI